MMDVKKNKEISAVSALNIAKMFGIDQNQVENFLLELSNDNVNLVEGNMHNE